MDRLVGFGYLRIYYLMIVTTHDKQHSAEATEICIIIDAAIESSTNQILLS
jgi:hypothetical protein